MGGELDEVEVTNDPCDPDSYSYDECKCDPSICDSGDVCDFNSNAYDYYECHKDDFANNDIIDCNGDAYGYAYESSCGCIGGNTGIDECPDEDEDQGTPPEPETPKSWYFDSDGDGYHSQTTSAVSTPGAKWKTTTSGADCDDTKQEINKLNKCEKCAPEPPDEKKIIETKDKNNHVKVFIIECDVPVLSDEYDCNATGHTTIIAKSKTCGVNQDRIVTEVYTDICGNRMTAFDCVTRQECNPGPMPTECDSNDCYLDTKTCGWIVNVNAWFKDKDGDGYGNSNELIHSLNQPSGFVEDNTDCDDNNTNVHKLNKCEKCEAEPVNGSCEGDDCKKRTGYLHDANFTNKTPVLGNNTTTTTDNFRNDSWGIITETNCGNGTIPKGSTVKVLSTTPVTRTGTTLKYFRV